MKNCKWNYTHFASSQYIVGFVAETIQCIAFPTIPCLDGPTIHHHGKIKNIAYPHKVDKSPSPSQQLVPHINTSR